MISIIVPTYNEKRNIIKLIPNIYRTLEEYEHEIVVVDDNSPDGTAKVAKELSKNYPVKVLRRSGKLGLASAILHGFKHAEGDILGVIDADMQHPPECIKDFVQAILSGYDLAVGSRYMRGRNIQGWSRLRLLVSKGAIMLSKPLTDVNDPMSGYFFLRRKVIKGITFNPIGYKILLEILVKGCYNNIKEVPYTFKIRENGKSKLGIVEYINYLKLLYHLYGFRLKRLLY